MFFFFSRDIVCMIFALISTQISEIFKTKRNKKRYRSSKFQKNVQPGNSLLLSSLAVPAQMVALW